MRSPLSAAGRFAPLIRAGLIAGLAVAGLAYPLAALAGYGVKSGSDALQRMPGADALRWTGRPGWHFTLAFYGEVADDVVPDLTERLLRAIEGVETAVWAVAEELQGGVGLRLGRRTPYSRQ